MENNSNDGGEIMINITLNDDDIRVGDKVVYISDNIKFNDVCGKTHHVNVSKAIGTVIDIIGTKLSVEFDDISFLPKELQSIKFWFVADIMMEKY